ncbi:MAG: ComF family protein [Candidatus Paceibacteria bacterium]
MHIWELLIDYIFPPSPEELLVRKATTEDIMKEYCPSLKSDVYFFSNYQRKLIKASVTTAKFTHNKKAVLLLSTILKTWLEEHTKCDTLLIPIPLHSKRERERGYNQVRRVIEEVKHPQIITSNNVLKRNRHTVPQTSLEKNERVKNLTDAFSVNTKNLALALSPETKRVIICDDVCTTGSTLREARKVLAPHLPKHCDLICLAWAH